MPAPLLRVPAACAVALALLALPGTASAGKTASPKLPATFQQRYHVTSAVGDPDRDGLTNFTEYRAHTNPKKADSDRDGTSDGSEDRDGDKLDNAGEQRAGTDPGRRDSDGDGRADGREDADHDGLNNLAEQRTANDPGNPDSDNDGTEDGDEYAGQVVSFADGQLTLRLASSGKTVTAAVDGDTAVECNGSAEYESDYDDSATVDPSESNSADVPSDDSTDATSGSVRAAIPADDRSGAADDASASTSADDAAADDGTASGTGDPCVENVLAPGAWVHEAEISTDDDGSLLFDALALVDDRSQGGATLR